MITSQTIVRLTMWGDIAISKNSDCIEAVNKRSVLLPTHLHLKEFIG